ncbi:hypothetical protein [uncultured Anaerococcus sp.]|uniref:hypothetical protein n=1 Tax=uncultured Anaerococcus sp. TaxID=293428 RepID=UPI00288924A1|nr:hypothetical protein [uncultured Anaerococcus sp.]
MIKIYLLRKDITDFYNFHDSFVAGRLDKDGYFTENFVDVPPVEDFIPYAGNADNNSEVLKNLIYVMINNFIELNQDIYMNESFWRSYLVQKLRMPLIKKYPKLAHDYNLFDRIVLRKFNWENYLFKAATYGIVLSDRVGDPVLLDEYIDIICDNMDLFNYILKLKALKVDNFIYNTIKFMHEFKDTDLGSFLKYRSQAEINKEDSAGRIVLTEMNTAYPSILFPMLDYDDFKDIFFKYLTNNLKINLLIKQYGEKYPDFSLKKIISK